GRSCRGGGYPHRNAELPRHFRPAGDDGAWRHVHGLRASVPSRSRRRDSEFAGASQGMTDLRAAATFSRADVVRPEWVDYNGHMGDFAYAIAFSQTVTA